MLCEKRKCFKLSGRHDMKLLQPLHRIVHHIFIILKFL